MININKPFEYRLRITYLNGDKVDVYHYSDRAYADEAMSELYDNETKKIFVTKQKPLRPMCINAYQIRSIEYLCDKNR